MSDRRKLRRPPVILDTRVLAGSGGGPDKTLINSPAYLRSAGYRMLCAYLHDPHDAGFASLRNKAAEKNVDLISVADHGATDWRVVPRMLEVCRREKVDVWHGHDYKTNLLGLILNRRYPMRLVTTVHGWVQKTSRTPLYYLIDRLTLRFYERVICVSDDLYSASRKAGVSASKCILLRNGIDLNDYVRRLEPPAARSALGWAPERFTIGGIGRLSAEKGFDILMKAVDRLIGEGRDVQLVIAGAGAERAALEQLAAELNRGDRIRLLGQVDRMIPVYEALDVFALTSYREGLPNVLLEAMAMHVPVVSTAVNGIPQLINDGVDGDLITAGSVDATAAALRRLMDDPIRRANMAAAARSTVETRFSFAERMASLARIYDRMGIPGGYEVTT